MTTLGIVINSLTDPDKTHIPYRDSKLTRMLSVINIIISDID